MRFSLSREAFLKPLQQVVNVVERRQTLPVLSNLLVQVENGQLSLKGTDLEVELAARCSISARASAPLPAESRCARTRLPATSFLRPFRTRKAPYTLRRRPSADSPPWIGVARARLSASTDSLTPLDFESAAASHPHWLNPRLTSRK